MKQIVIKMDTDSDACERELTELIFDYDHVSDKRTFYNVGLNYLRVTKILRLTPTELELLKAKLNG
jgi:hypothetical protein